MIIPFYTKLSKFIIYQLIMFNKILSENLLQPLPRSIAPSMLPRSVYHCPTHLLDVSTLSTVAQQ